MKLGVLAAGFALSFLTVPVFAHHSWTAEYDSKKPVTVNGVVTKIARHAGYWMRDENGKVTNWNFEMASTPALERSGWSRKTLPIGTKVTVTGFGGREVLQRAIVTSFKGPDGKEFFVPKLGN